MTGGWGKGSRVVKKKTWRVRTPVKKNYCKNNWKKDGEEKLLGL